MENPQERNTPENAPLISNETREIAKSLGVRLMEENQIPEWMKKADEEGKTVKGRMAELIGVKRFALSEMLKCVCHKYGPQFTTKESAAVQMAASELCQDGDDPVCVPDPVAIAARRKCMEQMAMNYIARHMTSEPPKSN